MNPTVQAGNARTRESLDYISDSETSGEILASSNTFKGFTTLAMYTRRRRTEIATYTQH